MSWRFDANVCGDRQTGNSRIGPGEADKLALHSRGMTTSWKRAARSEARPTHARLRITEVSATTITLGTFRARSRYRPVGLPYRTGGECRAPEAHPGR